MISGGAILSDDNLSGDPSDLSVTLEWSFLTFLLLPFVSQSNGPIVIFSPHFGNAFGFAELTKYLPAVTGVLQIFTITCLRRKFTL